MIKKDDKGAAENFAEIFKEFGGALAEVFDDPKLKEKAREFGRSAVDSAKTLGGRFKDEEVRSRFRQAGRAAERFGENITEYFKDKE